MAFWKQYSSPLGYANNGNQIDSYGVDHSGFSTQDEVQYQTARVNRENELMSQMNSQGVTDYPQYGTNFWGNSVDNNYGFGTSNIANNIENMNRYTLENIASNPAQPVNTYLIPEEAYTDASWGQGTAQKLDEYMQGYNSYPGKTRTGLLAPFHDMWRNYKTMTDEQKWIGGDNFFHCKANYEAAKRGPWGELVGKTVSTGRELLGRLAGDALSDARKDWHANSMGWNGAKQGLTLKESCPTNPKDYANPNDYNNIF